MGMGHLTLGYNWRKWRFDRPNNGCGPNFVALADLALTHLIFGMLHFFLRNNLSRVRGSFMFSSWNFTQGSIYSYSPVDFEQDAIWFRFSRHWSCSSLSQLSHAGPAIIDKESAMEPKHLWGQVRNLWCQGLGPYPQQKESGPLFLVLRNLFTSEIL